MGGIKSLAKDTAIYGLSSIVGRFLNWCLVPIYTNVLPKNEFGVVTYIYSLTALLLIILTYGMETGFFRFANHDRWRDPVQVYTTSLISLGFTSVLFMIGACAFCGPLAELAQCGDHSSFICMMAIVVGVDAYTSIPFAWLRYQKRPVRFATLKLVSIAVNICLNLFFLLVCPWLMNTAPAAVSWFYDPAYGVGYIFLANLFSSLVTLMLLYPEITGVGYSFNGRLLKQMLTYSFPLLILGIAGVMNQSVDKILYPYLAPDKTTALEELGIYGANYKIAIVMVMFIQAFRFAYEPFIFARHRDRGDGDETKAYSDAMKYFIIFALLIFLTVMFYLDIIRYFIAPSYFSGLKVVPVVMLAELFFGIFFNLSLWYKLTDQTIWGTWFSLAGLAVTLLLNALLVPRMGYMGCAWAALACYGVMMTASYIIGQRKFPINYDLKTIVFYSVVTAGLYFPAEAITTPSEIVNYGLRTLILAAFCTLVIRREHIPLPFVTKHN